MKIQIVFKMVEFSWKLAVLPTFSVFLQGNKLIFRTKYKLIIVRV